jgi:O-antigen/teichoic acid export membrane protein
MNIIAESLKGLKDVASAAMVQNIIVPLLLMVTLFTVPAHFSSRNVASIYLGVTLISLAYGYFKWTSAIQSSDVQHVSPNEVIRFGWPFFLANIGSMILTWSDTIMVGMFANAEVVASYYAASKLATLTSFILISINAISAPKFTAMHTLGDSAGLERLARQSTTITIALALIPTILLVSFPTFWLHLFGAKFDQAKFSLLVLTAGQAINVACGSVGLLLAMTGHEKTMSKIFLTTAMLTIGMSLGLGMHWGANGVAVSTAIGMATWNIWMLVAVRRYLGFWTFPLFSVRNITPINF